MTTQEITVSNVRPGMLLCLSAPSGAGKTTLARRLLKEMPELVLSISYTTRPPRGQEKDGVDYHFIDAKAFKKRIDENAFVEWAEVHNNFYGTSLTVVDDAYRAHGVAVFDIDVQGGYAIKKKYPDALLVFVLPPSLEELERRLRDRKTDTEDSIQRRMLAARAELERGVAGYDFLIMNDDFETAFAKLKSIVTSEQCRNGRASITPLRG